MSGSNGHIDLEGDGLPGQWLDIADIGTKSPNQFRVLKTLPTDPDALAALPEAEAKEAGRKFLAMCVKQWSVNDPQTGEALPPPNSEALDPDCVPMAVTARIRAEIGAQMEDLSTKKALSRRV